MKPIENDIDYIAITWRACRILYSGSTSNFVWFWLTTS